MIVTSEEQLRTVFRETLEEARRADDLLTPDELAERFRVSRTQIHHLRKAGMPTIFLGTLPRFDYAQCRAWAAERSRKKAGNQ